ncbi:unnamed protein product [Heterobilharzia americana]|nr:unnamed protein product [Heterobilharzia americana]
MPFSPLDLLDDDHFKHNPEDNNRGNENPSRKEVKKEKDKDQILTCNSFKEVTQETGVEFDQVSCAQMHVGCKTEGLNMVEKASKFEINPSPKNSLNSNWRSIPNRWGVETLYLPQDELNKSENNQSVSDEPSYLDYSKIDIDSTRSIETRQETNDNLQPNLPHNTITTTSVTPRSTASSKNMIQGDSNTTDTVAYIEVTESEKEMVRQSTEIPPIVKPAVRTRKHIPNTSQSIACSINLIDKEDKTLINSPVITSKEKQSIIHNNKQIGDVILKSIHHQNTTSPRLSMKRSKSSCQLSNQKMSDKNLGKPYHKGDECILNAVILRDLAYQSCLRNDVSETKKEKEKLERMKSNEICFKTWKQNKHQLLIETMKKRKAEELAQKKKLEEEQERRRNSEKAFEVWKARKDEVIIKQHRERLNKQKQEKEVKESEENEKQHLSQQAFENWKSKKDTVLQQNLKCKLKHQLEKEKQQEEANRIKLEQAAAAYYQWELKKVASVENLAISIDNSSKLNRRPWRPPSKIISPMNTYRMY